MTIQKKLLGLLATTFSLFACSVNDADDEIYWPEANSSSSNAYSSSSDVKDDTTYTTDELELSYNYDLLYFFYINSDTELDAYDTYHGATGSGYLADTYYMYGRMKDAYTNYFGPEYVEEMTKWLYYSEQDIGIGAEASMKDSAVVISQVYPKGPAETAGLEKGDTVKTIDGVVPVSVSSFEKLTAGSAGTTVTLEVARDTATVTIEITLGAYITPTVFVDEIDSIPVIRITGYTDTTVSDSGTYGEFLSALKATDGAKATIIDLRDNPGGSTDQCLNVTAELLAKGDTIIIERSTDADTVSMTQKIDTTVWAAAEDGYGYGRRYVLLANNGSGSCSEVQIAGMIKNLETPVVGEITYGKGIGQYYFFTYEGIARMTAMQIFDKDMASYHKVGIEPDFEIADADSALAMAVEIAKDATIKRDKGYGTTDQGHFPSKYLAKSANGKASWEKGLFRVKKH